MNLDNEFKEESFLHKNQHRIKIGLWIMGGIIIFIVVCLSVIIFYKYDEIKTIINETNKLCEDICKSHDGTTLEVKVNTNANDICVCKERTGIINTYII